MEHGDQTIMLGGNGDEMRDWTDVRDVVRLLTALIDLPQSQPFRVINGGSGQGTSVADVITALVRHWGTDIPVRYSGVARTGDPRSLIADNAALQRLHFDWRISIDRGIADYVDWFKDRVR